MKVFRAVPPILLPCLASLGLLPVAGAARAAPPDAGKTYKVRAVENVSYYDGKGTDIFRHKLDLFVPEGKKDFPVVVLVHGGAWMYGDKSSAGLYSNVGRFLAEHGVGAVLPNYRLSPWVKHPEHVKDVARAFAWARAHVAKYGGDPDRMFIAGHSAGGHLAALLATDDKYLKAEGLSRKAVRGAIAVSGVYRIPDKLALDLPALGGAPGMRLDLGFNPFDLVFGKDPKVRKDAAPLSHVGPGLPSFLIVYAENDLPLMADMAKEFAKALKDNKCDVELMMAKDRHHSDAMFDATSTDDPVGKAMLDFVAKHSSCK
jgi:acetyl esterase/lipase